MTLIETAQLLGNFGEFLAAIAVVVSLVYLARQIHSSSAVVQQNTNAIKASSESSSLDTVLQIHKMQIESHEVNEIALKGHAGDELNVAERSRYGLLLSSIFEAHQTYFIQHSRGTTGPETWAFYARSFGTICALPGPVRWWSSNRKRFDAAFQTYVDAKIPVDSS
jgi:hypothetical protein